MYTILVTFKLSTSILAIEHPSYASETDFSESIMYFPVSQMHHVGK